MSDSESEPVQPKPEGPRDVARDEPGVVIDESAPGDASRRALEDWDAVPGEEHAVDFPDAGNRDPGTSDAVRDVLAEPSPELESGYEGGNVAATWISPRVGQLSTYESVPALDIEINIATPDGRTFSFREGQEFPDGDAIDDATIHKMFDALATNVCTRFAAPRPRPLRG